MSNVCTTGKRTLKADGWHDDNGPIAGLPDEWDPPMTEAEVHEAALSDPDAQPLSHEQLSRMRRVAVAKRIRWKLKLSQQDFAERFRIPIDTLRDWERHRSEPDIAMLAYLTVIEREPEAVARALEPA